MNNNAEAFSTDGARNIIAANLAAELKRLRWTGRSAASALGLSQPYVARRLSGDTELSGSDIALFAAFLKVPVSRFFVGLPDLDSNQEPAGFMPAPEMQPIVTLADRRKATVPVTNHAPAIVSTFHLNA